MRTFVHLSDADRREALAALRLAKDGHRWHRTTSPTDGDLRRTTLEATLDPVRGNWQFATLTKQADELALSFRAGWGASPHLVTVSQPGAWGDGFDPELAEAVLKDWSSALAAVADEEDRSVVEAARSAHVEILQAAADAFDPLWTRATLTPGLAGLRGHAVVHSDRDTIGADFLQGREANRTEGGMTDGLGRLLERAADPFRHVTGRRGGRPRLLQVNIGKPPEIALDNLRDPMATMRRLARLPEDARLVPPRF